MINKDDFKSIISSNHKKYIKNGIIYTMIGLSFFGIKNGYEKYNNRDEINITISDYDIDKGKYLKKLSEAYDMGYDEFFKEFYDNGLVLIENSNGELSSHKLNKMYIVRGISSDSKYVSYLVDVEYGDIDILLDKKYDGIDVTSIIDFKKSTILYDLFISNYDKETKGVVIKKDELLELSNKIFRYDGLYHKKVPETMALLTPEEAKNGRKR